MPLRISAKQMNTLAQLRDRLADPHKNWGRLPDVLPTGEDVKELDHVAAVMGTDLKTAALAVLQSKDACDELVIEAKDVYAMSGGSTTVVSLGTRRESHRNRIVQRAGALEQGKRRKKRRKRVRDLFSQGKAAKVKCPRCGTEYFADGPEDIKKHKQECVQNKALHGQPESDFDGIAIMLPVEAFDGWPGGVKTEDLHITLLYLGKTDDYKGPLTEQQVIEQVRNYAKDHEGFMPTLAGITRFSSHPDPDKDYEYPPDPIVANVDSPEVDEMRKAMVEMFGKGPSYHGYTPHMTLAYVDRDDPMPVQRFQSQPVLVTAIRVGWGKNTTDIPLLKIGSKEQGEDQ